MGILQAEADRIDEYLCPKCDPVSKLNLPNNKKLTKADVELIKRLTKQLVVRWKEHFSL